MSGDFAFLPFIFASLMGLSILIYVVLDGFDLGIGILFPLTKDKEQQDQMIATIGPFWDANETWLVLAVGLLLVAFPVAHGIILSALYLPVFVLLFGLILRGVSFEFRAKADIRHKARWDFAFFAGSLMASLAQGFMLGIYIMGLQFTAVSIVFACLTALCLTSGYALIGAGWLILKTENDLQTQAIDWARKALWLSLIGMVAVSVASPLADPRIFEKWFSVPEIILLAPLPILSFICFAALWIVLRRLPKWGDSFSWLPFNLTMALFALAYIGLAYSFYPYVVPGQMTVYEAAAAPESLVIILIGAVFVLPMILGYTALSYYIFRGKLTELRYD
ncbi:MAG: cytochrome d ubiquinol oxidase subunit II [Aquisalinus sp.]|nr:cytochrome d ubiquinol oxidase subunit II [Aquisalinus sp.]